MTPSRKLKEFLFSRANDRIWAYLKGVESSPPTKWAPYCKMPLAAAMTYISGNAQQLDKAILATCLYIWSKTRGVYRYHPELYAEIKNTPLKDLPSEVLLRLPEWCVYIDTPGETLMGEETEGFWAWLDNDLRDNTAELRLLVLLRDGNLSPFALLLKYKTIEDTFDYLSKQAVKQKLLSAAEQIQEAYEKDLKRYLQLAVNLIAYLCADESDIVQTPEAIALKRKKNWGISNLPAYWQVGERIGAAITKYKTARYADDGESGGAQKRPHTRKAHWHHYRVGEGRQQLICKWLPPIPVNWDKENENTMPVVIHKVKGGK